MIEDMRVRGFTASTQRGYIRAVRDFTAFFGRSPDQAAADLRRYQLHMRSIGASATGMNAAVSALRFFFTVTLGRGDAQAGMTTLREPRKLPGLRRPYDHHRHLRARFHTTRTATSPERGRQTVTITAPEKRQACRPPTPATAPLGSRPPRASGSPSQTRQRHRKVVATPPRRRRRGGVRLRGESALQDLTSQI